MYWLIILPELMFVHILLLDGQLKTCWQWWLTWSVMCSKSKTVRKG